MGKVLESQLGEGSFYLFSQRNFRFGNIIILKPKTEHNSAHANAVYLEIKTKDKKVTRRMGRSTGIISELASQSQHSSRGLGKKREVQKNGNNNVEKHALRVLKSMTDITLLSGKSFFCAHYFSDRNFLADACHHCLAFGLITFHMLVLFTFTFTLTFVLTVHIDMLFVLV